MSNFNFTAGEMLLIDKPLNWTSFDVVSKIRNTLKPLKIKVGHAGTLDPLATGLLIVCTGKFTKRIEEYQAQTKTYTGTFVLGASTPSYDRETKMDAVFDCSTLTPSQLHENCQQFIGGITQEPPLHSAVKQNGERLYEKARRGESVEIRKRQVFVERFVLTNIRENEVDFEVVCSKGTYIRSLVHDFGKALHNGAYLKNLCRTHIGAFNLTDAKSVSQWVELIKDLKAKEILQ